MQYTAGSFSEIITGWFAWILRPERREVWAPERTDGVSAPSGGVLCALEEHTPETVLEQVFKPAAGAVMRAATAVRRLQHGRLPAYFLYVLAGLAGLAAIVYASCT